MNELQERVKQQPQYVVHQSQAARQYPTLRTQPRSVYDVLEQTLDQRSLHGTFNAFSMVPFSPSHSVRNFRCCVCGTTAGRELPYACPACGLGYCDSYCAERHRPRCRGAPP